MRIAWGVIQVMMGIEVVILVFLLNGFREFRFDPKRLKFEIIKADKEYEKRRRNQRLLDLMTMDERREHAKRMRGRS